MKNQFIITIAAITVLAVFSCNSIYASNEGINFSKYNYAELKTLAKKAEKQNDFYTAIACYQQMYTKSKNAATALKLGQLYEAVNDYTIAAEFYQESTRDRDKKNKALFYYARILKKTGNAEKALKHFKIFLRQYRGAELKKYRLLTLNEIKGCKTAIKKPKNNDKIDIAVLGDNVNGLDAEFSPIVLSDSMIYFGSTKLEKQNSYEPQRKLFLAEKQNNEWIANKEIIEKFNIKGKIANASISPDGHMLFVTISKKNFKGKSIGEIYMSKKIGTNWGELSKLNKNINYPNTSNTQPSVAYSVNKKEIVLYFSSDRKNGFGGFDIWYSIFNTEKNEFRKAKNLGNRINSPGDEITPFYDNENRTLYFSSDGLPGYGGLDVFKTSGEKNYWRKVENIGMPINSHLDEFYYSINNYNDGGFFVSNRIEADNKLMPSCCDDIFAFKDNGNVKIEIRGNLFTEVSGENGSMSELAESFLDNTKIQLIKLDNQGELLIKASEVSQNKFFIKNLEPNQEYKLKVENEYFYNKDIVFITPSSEHSTTVNLDKIELAMLPDQSIELENIYYEYDEYRLTGDSKNYIDTTLLLILEENKEINIELLAHTDSKGSSKYNKDLSQKRAESVANYLVSKGINGNRIKANGMGEEHPKSDNSTTEGRKLNRRTEFKILNVESKDKYAYNK